VDFGGRRGGTEFGAVRYFVDAQPVVSKRSRACTTSLLRSHSSGAEPVASIKRRRNVLGSCQLSGSALDRPDYHVLGGRRLGCSVEDFNVLLERRQELFH